MSGMQPHSILQESGDGQWSCPDWKARAVASAVFVLLLSWLFFDLLKIFVNRWATEPQYSHGFVVPLMAVGLGWFLFDRVRSGVAECSPWGLLWIAIGVLLHITGVYLFIEFAESLGLLACIFGGVLLLWGQRMTLGVWPAILFLVFMFPLPFRIERLLSAPLQLYGAEQSAWYIQLFGIPAVAQGSMILMGDHRVGVAEACSGMRMLTVFIAISAATMIITKRSPWEKMLILLSAIPIALICNIARIVATALGHHYFGQETADLIFHDLSGWLMMPSAMLLLYLLLKLLDWLFVPAPEARDKLATAKPMSGIPGVPRVSH